MIQNHSILNSFSDVHTNRLRAEILGNNPNVNVFNALIREGLGEDEADEHHNLGMREPIFGKSVPRTHITSEQFADNLMFMESLSDSDEPTLEELDLARRQDDAISAMNTVFIEGEITAVHQFTESAKFTESVRTRPGHLAMINTDALSNQYDREQLQKMLNAPSNKPVRQPRPNKVFNPRMPDEVPSHLQAVFALNAANRNKKGRGSNR